ncbi:MAG: glycosyltransferase family 4 protein [Planctomycetaceae bacterium]
MPTSPRTNGVNIRGYLRTESGVGAATRGYVRALRSLDVPVAFQDLSQLCLNRAGDDSLTTADPSCPHDINLVCVDVEKHYAALSQIGEDCFEECYNIGVWWWELMRFPKKWHDRFAYYDEIWVGTSFIANSLAPVSPLPVVRIPPVLAPETLGAREAGRRRLNISAADFVYLFIFDFNSTHKRKNPLAVVDAFRKAFRKSDPVCLVIKCVNEQENSAPFSELLSQIGDYPVHVLSGFWTMAEMQDLMAACDAYVSLHRSEGAGLTIADAMAHGKPVIATGWSGNMDFMNFSNSFPVDYELVELDVNAGPYQAGEIWAEPSVEHAAELLRRVYLNPDEASARGMKAQHTIHHEFSEKNIGQIIKLRLDAIATRRRLSAFRDETRAAFVDYQALVKHVRDRASRLLPEDAAVLVVSKGDDELLRLKGLRSAHFPQAEGGGYAGCYPPGSVAAIEHLEELRRRGAEYLVFPATAFWWFDHFEEFRRHLDAYRLIIQDHYCAIFSLREMNGLPGSLSRAGADASRGVSQ